MKATGINFLVIFIRIASFTVSYFDFCRDMNSVRFDPTKVSVSSTKLTDSKKRETAIDPKTGSKQQLREASDSTNLKKEKKARKKEFAKVDDVAKPSKVNSDEDANNDQAEIKDHSTKKKGKESLSKK